MKLFRTLLPGIEKVIFQRYIDLKIETLSMKIIHQRYPQIFPTLQSHFAETSELCNSHALTMIRLISACFIRLRLHRHAQLFTRRILFSNQTGSRQQLNKLTLFRGQ